MFPNPPTKIDKEEPRLGRADVVNVPAGIVDHYAPYQKYRLGTSLNNDLNLAKFHNEVKQRVRSLGKSPRALIQIGDFYFEKGSFQRASKAYTNAIKEDPKLIEGYRKLINTFIALGDFNSADRIFKGMVAATNNHIDYKVDYLLFQLTNPHNSNWDSILSEFRDLLNDYGDNEKIHLSIGALLLAQGEDLDGASKHLKKALDINPASIHSLNNLGICYQKNGKLKEARGLYKKALDLNPKFSEAYENLASAYMEEKDFTKAVSILNRGDEHGLLFSEVWLNNYSWLLFTSQDNERAESVLRKHLIVYDTNIGFWNNLGVVQYARGKKTDAIESYKKSINLVLRLSSNYELEDSQVFNAFINLLGIYAEDHSFPQQKDLSKLLLNLDPENILGHYYLGAANLQMKVYDQVESHLLKAIEGRLDKSLPYTLLSFYYSSIMRQHQQAIDLILDMKTSLRNEGVLNNLAYAYLKNGDIDKAEDVLENNQTTLPVTHATIGLLKYKKGSLEEGDRYYQIAYETIGDSEKNHVLQVWKFEQALFHLNNMDFERALESVNEAASQDESFHRYDEILELQKQIKKTIQSN